MSISDYYTSAGLNTAMFGEGQMPGSVNDGMRAVLADIHTAANDGPWINYGNGSGPPAYTYVSGTEFSVTGDVASVYHQYRRCRAVGAVTGTIYGTITSGTHNSGTTTVTVSWDSGSLANETFTISLWLPYTGAKEARLDRTQTFTGANTFSGDTTVQDLYVEGQLYQSGVPADPPEFGSAATKNTGTSGGTVPLLNTSCTWLSSTTQTFGAINVTTFKINGVTYNLGSASTYNVGNSGSAIPLLSNSNTFSGTQTFNTIDVQTLRVGGQSRNAASTTVAGLVELATAAEYQNGTDTTRALTANSIGNGVVIGNPTTVIGQKGLVEIFGFTTTNAGGTFTESYGTILSVVRSLQLTALNSSHTNLVVTNAGSTSFSVLATDANGNSKGSVTVYWEVKGSFD